ncbi:hypothetical protein [Leptotrichia massiliensis]|uniref:hypothetical protein n=1 Tax=Leptotrichia massiliensis TaxID=1852388 RepID=UPI0008D920E8|nr:hypothetical protein [Leptotrichia massiliensis]
MKNSEGNYTLGRNNEWNFDTKYNIPYTETGNKGQGLVSVPTYKIIAEIMMFFIVQFLKNIIID